MEHNHHTQPSEVTFHHEPAQGTKRIWKTFWLLLIITVVELVLGFAMYFAGENLSSFIELFLKGVIIILSLLKAFYIVGIFMHLGDELKNMIMTIIVPLSLFIWFIGAFLWDGNYWRAKRNRYMEGQSLDRHTMQEPKMKKDTAIFPLQ